MDVKGKKLIEYVIEGVKASRRITRIVLATGNQEANKPLAEVARRQGVYFFMGSEEDVLDRFYQAVKSIAISSAAIVRITGDCPLIDPQVIDQVIDAYHSSGVDYASNIAPPTFPDGLDTEVFSFHCLQKTWEMAQKPEEREHVTIFMRESGLFSTKNVTNPVNLSAERWTVDEPQDFQVFQNVIAEMAALKSRFTMQDILDLKKSKPFIFEVNRMIERNAGLKQTGESK